MKLNARMREIIEEEKRKHPERFAEEEHVPIELTSEMQLAVSYIQNPDIPFVWIIGRAGTGKTTFLNYLKKELKLPNAAYLAPTGPAALLINGQTLHSFFQIKPSNVYPGNEDLSDETKRHLYKLRVTDFLIIDEISMVRADLLDEVDRRLRDIRRNDNPFGGMKMVFFGDPYQLPPVYEEGEEPLIDEWFTNNYKSKYFFSSHVIRNNITKLKHIEFTKIFRQVDKKYIEVLERCRKGKVTINDIDFLNSRITNDIPEDVVTLTVRKKEAEKINEREYQKLETAEKKYTAKSTEEWDKINEEKLPAPRFLYLKVGTKVILTVNDKGKRWINGTLGIIKELSDDYVIVDIKGTEVKVERYEWRDSKYVLENGELVEKIGGKYIQFPMIYGWAMTIHRSQGKTLDKACVNFSKGTFEAGQGYVAVSRTRDLESLFLTDAVIENDFFVDDMITTYMNYVGMEDKNE